MAGFALGQSLSFEVASIKPAPALNPQAIAAGGKMHVGMQIDGNRVDIGHGNPFMLILYAFDLKMHQVDAPEWMLKNPQAFDILATLPEGAKSSQVPEMLQNLLKDRFGLKYHMVKQEKDVYALVVGKQPLKLEQVEIEEAKPADPAAAPEEPPKGGRVIQIPGGGKATVSPTGGFTMNMRPQAAKGIGNVRMKMDAPTPGGNPMDMKMTMEMEATMDAFVGQLSTLLDKPVVDMTDLKGGYKLPLEMSFSDLMSVAQKLGGAMGVNPGAMGGGAAGPGPAFAASDPGGGSSVKDSVQKLGLRLESRKVPIDVMVIDHMEKSPTEN